MITSAVWYEGKKGCVQSFRGKKWWWNRNCYGVPICSTFPSWWFLACSCVLNLCSRELQRFQWLCLHMRVHTVIPQGEQHVGSGTTSIVFLMWLPCQGSLAPFRRMSAIGWRMRVLFPKQLKTWQRWWTSMPTGINWVGGLIPLLFPQGSEELFRVKWWTTQADTIATRSFDILLRNYWKIFLRVTLTKERPEPLI